MNRSLEQIRMCRFHYWLLPVVLALVGTTWLPGCAQGTTTKPKEDGVLQLDSILAKLWNNDQAVREVGLKELRAFHESEKAPAANIGLKALRAAARPYSFEEPEADTLNNELISLAGGHPLPEYIPVVVELFDKFTAGGKWWALSLLIELKSRDGAEAVMKIIRTHAPRGGVPAMDFSALVKQPKNLKVYFPELLKFAGNTELSFEIYKLCLECREANLISTGDLAPFTDQFVNSYADAVKKVNSPRIEGLDWAAAMKKFKETKENTYLDAAQRASTQEKEETIARESVCLFLDLFAYFSIERVETLLREALESKDPRVQLFAVVSLLRHGKPVDPKHVESVARNAAIRIALYDRLKKIGKTDLYPEQFRTQKAFAEADMARWLTFPTELGKAPDEIELMKIVTIDTKLRGGQYDYYVFRFRTHEPHWAAKDGWMAGISGPFRLSTQPTTEALGETFSTFEKWGTKTPEELVGDTKELLIKWHEYHLKTRKD